MNAWEFRRLIHDTWGLHFYWKLVNTDRHRNGTGNRVAIAGACVLILRNEHPKLNYIYI